MTSSFTGARVRRSVKVRESPTMPVRTCVVSRAQLPAERLVRLGIDPSGGLSVRGAGPGRSAWVKPELRLLQKLVAKPSMVRRSLRQMPASTAHLVDSVAGFLAARLAHRLLLAWRSGTVREADVCRTQVGVRLRPWYADGLHENDYMLPWDALGVGCLLGRPRISALVALHGRPSRAMLHDLRIWRDLGYAPEPLTVSPSS
ncbi:MAG: hypothetical protein CL927_02955 [Deltaproteobacteria bacterium]|nr:hypothetical protein [Deltaproteobacteria bacterium]HCH66292.1 hypothetical protein [Deltaproteobacteria bacterium]